MKYLAQILVTLLSTDPERNQRPGKLRDFLRFIHVSGKHCGNECFDSLFMLKRYTAGDTEEVSVMLLWVRKLVRT